MRTTVALYYDQNILTKPIIIRMPKQCLQSAVCLFVRITQCAQIAGKKTAHEKSILVKSGRQLLVPDSHFIHNHSFDLLSLSTVSKEQNQAGSLFPPFISSTIIMTKEPARSVDFSTRRKATSRKATTRIGVRFLSTL